MKRIAQITLLVLLHLAGPAVDTLQNSPQQSKNAIVSSKKMAHPAGHTDETEITLPVEPTPESFIRHRAEAGFTCQLPNDFHIEDNTLTRWSAIHVKNTAVRVAVMVTRYGADFPVDYSLYTYRESAKQDFAKNYIEAFEAITLGKASGILRVENPTRTAVDLRRITVQAFAGTRGIQVDASAPGGDFSRYRATLSQLVRSIVF